jgi:hypothetical protein
MSHFEPQISPDIVAFNSAFINDIFVTVQSKYSEVRDELLVNLFNDIMQRTLTVFSMNSLNVFNEIIKKLNYLIASEKDVDDFINIILDIQTNVTDYTKFTNANVTTFGNIVDSLRDIDLALYHIINVQGTFHDKLAKVKSKIRDMKYNIKKMEAHQCRDSSGNIIDPKIFYKPLIDFYKAQHNITAESDIMLHLRNQLTKDHKDTSVDIRNPKSVNTIPVTNTTDTSSTTSPTIISPTETSPTDTSPTTSPTIISPTDTSPTDTVATDVTSSSECITADNSPVSTDTTTSPVIFANDVVSDAIIMQNTDTAHRSKRIRDISSFIVNLSEFPKLPKSRPVDFDASIYKVKTTLPTIHEQSEIKIQPEIPQIQEPSTTQSIQTDIVDTQDPISKHEDKKKYDKKKKSKTANMSKPVEFFSSEPVDIPVKQRAETDKDIVKKTKPVEFFSSEPVDIPVKQRAETDKDIVKKTKPVESSPKINIPEVFTSKPVDIPVKQKIETDKDIIKKTNILLNKKPKKNIQFTAPASEPAHAAVPEVVTAADTEYATISTVRNEDKIVSKYKFEGEVKSHYFINKDSIPPKDIKHFKFLTTKLLNICTCDFSKAAFVSKADWIFFRIADNCLAVSLKRCMKCNPIESDTISVSCCGYAWPVFSLDTVNFGQSLKHILEIVTGYGFKTPNLSISYSGKFNQIYTTDCIDQPAIFNIQWQSMYEELNTIYESTFDLVMPKFNLVLMKTNYLEIANFGELLKHVYKLAINITDAYLKK